MKKLLVLQLILILTMLSYAQQDPLFSQYIYNKVIVNPAFAGGDEALNISLIKRAQWVGIKGAPSTTILSVHSPTKGRRVGLGAYLSRDRIGPTINNNFMTTYSYRILREDSFFAFGIQGGLGYLEFDYNAIKTQDFDFVFSPNDIRRVLPDLNLGMYYQNKDFFVGISSNHLFENDYGFLTDDEKTTFTRLSRHFYVMAGNQWEIVEGIKFRPSALVKLVRNNNTQIDVNASILFKKDFWIGVSYRTPKVASFSMELKVAPKIKIGYAADFSLNQLQTQNFGSHEIRVEFMLPRKQKQEEVTPEEYYSGSPQ